MKKSLWNLYSWELKDIILISLLAVFWGVVKLSTVHLTLFATPFLVPFGLGDFAFEFVFGIFFIAATFSPYIMQKPGVATIAETLAAVVQILLGSPFAATLFISGFVQGVGAELGFMAFKYKKYNWLTMFLAAFLATVFSFVLGWYRGIWAEVAFEIIALRFIVRTISALAFSGVIAKVLADRLEPVHIKLSKIIANIKTPAYMTSSLS